MAKKIAVAGGGYAGMAAAFTLAEAGIGATVFESAKTLGGRARRVESEGIFLDNGQHILMGCYTATLSLIEKTCEAEKPYTRFPLELYVDELEIRARRLPSPLDLFAGFLLAKGISVRERMSALFFLGTAKMEQDQSVKSLLKQYRQGEKITRLLWEPLCISALNTPLETASARIFLAVLRDGLDGAGSDMIIPAVDLTTLFPEGAAKKIREAGGEVLTSTPVRSIRKMDRGFELETASGSLHFDQVIAAVPPWQLERLGLPPVEFSYQPIVTVYSQYHDAVSLPRPMTGFSGELSQWLFDRGRWCGQKGLIASVTSAQGRHMKLSHEEIAKQVHLEISARIPDLPDPLWQKVIAEKRATFASTPDLFRPKNETAWPGLYLAGDYTESEYPSTLEAATRSGMAAAGLALGSE